MCMSLLLQHVRHTSTFSGSGPAYWRVKQTEMRFWSYLWVLGLETRSTSGHPCGSRWHLELPGSEWNALLSGNHWSEVENLSPGSTKGSPASREKLIMGFFPACKIHIFQCGFYFDTEAQDTHMGYTMWVSLNSFCFCVCVLHRETFEHK